MDEILKTTTVTFSNGGPAQTREFTEVDDIKYELEAQPSGTLIVWKCSADKKTKSGLSMGAEREIVLICGPSSHWTIDL